MVDPEARHIHKSRSEYRDGYKAHIALQPETGYSPPSPSPPPTPPTCPSASRCSPASALAYKSSLTGPTAQAKPWLPSPKPATAGL